VTELEAKDPAEENRRLEAAVEELKASVDEMLEQGELAATGEHREVLEAYRMFAHDKGWVRRLREAVEAGLTAEAAVERVQNGTRARMLRQNDAYWRERQRDLDDLSDRLLRILAGRITSADAPSTLPPDTILVARTMGPADLLDYDRKRLRGLIVEDGSGQSHVAIVAKALGIAAVGQARGVVERVTAGDAAIVDATTGEVHLRPSADVISAYSDKVRFLARRQRQYRALKDVPAVTADGVKVDLHINAGLLVDMPHLKDSGADGVGLFRTELLFMLSNTLPKVERQADSYRAIVARADGKPVVFRTLDIGGDKVLHYLRQPKEENPAMGWRAVRMGLDRPALLRTQVRALLRAAAGQELRVMIPMVSTAQEMDAVHALVQKEHTFVLSKGHDGPKKVLIGAMIEVPCLLFELDALMKKVDFVSVGSNDLMQFMFAADRTNARVGSRYDSLSPAPLRALKSLVKAAEKHKVPLTLCGEMAGRPIEALALIALGFRSLSMAPASIGPVKTMILSLDANRAAKVVDDLLKKGTTNIRERLDSFAKSEGIEA
ncbi:MAG: phosphoenolpyruvate--protein phosphotransferase, partial [Hyphomicrobium sp.]|nr:phosphoenolpyruvate--protein phosphotransferase [Hyphomicrobium sp.]